MVILITYISTHMMRLELLQIKLPLQLLQQELSASKRIQLFITYPHGAMMQKITFVFWLSLAAVLSACQTYNTKVDKDSPSHTPPVGSIIELNQPISVYPGYSRSFIQFGKPVKSREVSQRYPWCQFRLYEPPAALEAERRIQPDKFLVTQSNRRFEIVATRPQLLASSILWLNILDDAPSDQNLSSIMKLQSKRQPQVVEFKCSVLTEPQIYNHVTINEMQQALGEVVTIHIPTK
jgi:hypothetical protein